VCDFGGPTERVHLVGVSISFEKKFYRLPFTPPLSGRLIGPSASLCLSVTHHCAPSSPPHLYRWSPPPSLLDNGHCLSPSPNSHYQAWPAPPPQRWREARWWHIKRSNKSKWAVVMAHKEEQQWSVGAVSLPRWGFGAQSPSTASRHQICLSNQQPRTPCISRQRH
jgi:hypothetical protein